MARRRALSGVDTSYLTVRVPYSKHIKGVRRGPAIRSVGLPPGTLLECIRLPGFVICNDFLLDRNHPHVRVSVAAEVRAFEASFRPASLAAVFAQSVSALARVFAAVVESAAAGAAARAVVFAPGPRAAVAVVALAVVSAVLALASCAIDPALAGVSSPTQDSLVAAHSVALQRAARWDGAVQQQDDPLATVPGDCSAPQAVLADAQAADLLADAQLADSAAPGLASAACLVPCAWRIVILQAAGHVTMLHPTAVCCSFQRRYQF
jgi:hypothetical protein